MTRLLAIPLALSMAACSTLSTPPSNRAPVPDPLPAKTAEPCPPLPRLDNGLLATLVTWAGETAILYAACQAKHGAAVESYTAARKTAIAADSARSNE